MEFKNLIYSVDDGICTIKLNRPAAWNALCAELNYELWDALHAANNDKSVRALIITGGEKVFAAGADIKEMLNADTIRAQANGDEGEGNFNYIESMSIPVIAAVCGPALGGGCELTMACDFRVVARDAKFGQPEVGLGILPGAGGTQRLAALVGMTRAKEMVLLGKQIDGVRAEEIGLATVAVDAADVYPTALEMAKKLSRNPAYAMAMAKAAMNKGFDYGVAIGKQFERELFALCFANEDQHEGMAAFTEKRKPNYKNKR